MSELIHIVMNADETVQTAKGPVVFKREKDYRVEPWISASLVGRGLASLVDEKQAKKDDIDYESMTVAELRKIASERGVEGYNFLRKKELLEILSTQVVQGVSPAPQSFEHIPLVVPDDQLGEPKQEPDWEE